MVLSELVEFEPWFSAEIVKACALIGLHMMSEENSKKYGLGRPWPRRRFCEHTVDDLAIEVVGQHWTNEAISLSTEDWEVGRVPSSCHLFVSRNEECVQGDLRVSGFPSLSVFREPKKVSGRIVSSSRAFLSPWTGRGRFIPLRGPRMDIKILNNLFLTIERGNPWKRQDQTTLRIMVHPGLLKCGKVDMESTIDQGNLIKIFWDSLGRVDPHRGEHLLGRTAHSARNEETIYERTEKPASENVQGKANFEKFIEGSDTTEFVNKVRNQVRIRQKRMSDDAEDCTEHSIIWRMFMATTLNAVTFMGKSYSTMQNVVQNEENLTLKQMFDITAQTIHNDEEIYCLDKIVYQRNTWTQLSLINDPVIISLQSTKVYVFSDSVLCLGKVLQHPECNEAWKNRVAGVRAERNYRDFEDVKGESTEFEWNIFPGFTTLQLCDKINNLLSSLGQSPETFTGRILFMSMFNDISCDGKGNKEQCLKDADFVKTFAKRFGIGRWSFIGPGSEKKWYPSENSPQGEWDHIAEDMLLRFAESGHPIFRSTTPLSRGKLKSKGKGKVSIHFSADQDTVDSFCQSAQYLRSSGSYMR